MPKLKKDYEKQRKKQVCEVCGQKAYRKRMCKPCYRRDRSETFHCTVKNCVSPVFAQTLCQRHFQIFHTKCLMCDKHTYYRHLCRSHYRLASSTGNFPIEPTCKHCDKKEYLMNLCINHFKDQFSECSQPGCKQKSHKKGMCCAHYFRWRRRYANQT